MPVNFTPEQRRVINIRDRDLLVSAAAGSGKTAVLVERIIGMVAGKEDPEDGAGSLPSDHAGKTDIDRLLVVTFTEAAAAEMRERIGDAIAGKLLEHPEDEHLQRQASLLHKAQISTIHSFCLNVIRNNFHRIGLDPSFRIADETELTLLSGDVLEDLFEKHYEEGDEKFLNLLACYSPGASDDRLKEAVLRIAEHAEGYPWPEEWLSNCIGQYFITDVTELNETPWIRYLCDYCHDRIALAADLADEAIRIASSPGGPYHYLDVLRGDRDALEELLHRERYEELSHAVKHFSFASLPGKSLKDVEEEKKEQVKEIRNRYRGILGSTKQSGLSSLLCLTPEEELKLLSDMRETVSSLVDLVREYLEDFRARKQEEGILGFSDMEHDALRILYNTEGDDHTPSETALEYREYFDEILMDEYQDCNRIQELIILAVARPKARFMVGDVKQSIYRFRLASPELFIEKYGSYPIYDPESQEELTRERIDLHKNFRSRETVINTVNDLFGQIMHHAIGGVEYDENARLVPGADYPDPKAVLTEKNEDPFASEILFLIKDNDSDLTKGEQEALMLSHRIRHLLKEGWVTDKETEQLRRPRYRDMVILLRSMTDVAEGIRKVFRQEGIPFYMNLNSGFYDTNEVLQILQLLKVIDNPMQEIPLYGTLISYFGGFTEEEIVRIRKEEYGRDLYEQLCYFRDRDEKAGAFLSFIDRYRDLAVYTPIRELISSLVIETGYLDHVSALAGGMQRRSNVLKLVEKAAQYENTSYRGLFHFVRYVKELKRTESQEGEADVSDENADVVRIMTIHKSKGLEFPICFLAGVHKQFNRTDLTGHLIPEMEFGLGSSYVDVKNRVKLNPLLKKTTILKLRRDEIGEELRVLYVAMTRAREKLIITGVINEKLSETGKNFDTDISEAGSFLDMIKPLASEAKILTLSDLAGEEVTEAADRIGRTEDLLGLYLPEAKDSAEYRELRKRMERTYAHPELAGMILKTSVSELKKPYLDFAGSAEMFREEEGISSGPDTEGKTRIPNASEGSPEESRIPVSASGQDKGAGSGISGTDRGSAYHKIMELLDFTDPDVEGQIRSFTEKEQITKEWADAVSPDKIRRFLASPLASRMAKAQKEGKLYREQPFVLGISADRVKEQFPASETVLLQGIIDAFFIEGEEIVLLDYKTDVIDSPEALLKRYHVQLDYYAEALNRILGMPVKEKLLYSFCLNEVCLEIDP